MSAPTALRYCWDMNVVGLSAYYHESACCLFQDGRLVAAAEEERFSRIKHDAALPAAAFRFCLREAGLDVTDLDCVAWYEDPAEKLGRQLWSGRGLGGEMRWLDCSRAAREIRSVLGYEGPIRTYPHHLSHAASAWFVSGFDEAAVLVVDGVGEWATMSYGRGQDDDLALFEAVEFPHSIGLFYSAITSYLGFRVNGGEYKVMWLAPYGEPRLLGEMQDILRDGPAGSFTLDLACFDFLRGNQMFSAALLERLGGPARLPEGEVTSFHADVAASAQRRVEDLLLAKVGYLAERTGCRNLCMAGG